MITRNGSNRRSFMKYLVASPLLAQITAKDISAKSLAAVGLAPSENPYTKIGVRTVINCRGTWTYLSGSLEFPEVREAQIEAGHHFVNMVELQQGVGRKLAELTGAESGMITSGAAGAMATSTAACMAGTDGAKIWQLPDTTGMKHEVIMVGGRSAFDSAIRLTGAKLILVEGPDQIANAVNDNTAMIYTTDLGDKLVKEVAIAKDKKVPMLLDDAAGIPPAQNLKLYAQMKIDLYTFSGGKGLRGPQCSGVLLGRKDLIDAGLRNSAPWEGAVCRAMKVGKEEIIGCLTAVETLAQPRREKAVTPNGRPASTKSPSSSRPSPASEPTCSFPTTAIAIRRLRVYWDQEGWGYSIDDCVFALRKSDPVHRSSRRGQSEPRSRRA